MWEGERGEKGVGRREAAVPELGAVAIGVAEAAAEAGGIELEAGITGVALPFRT